VYANKQQHREHNDDEDYDSYSDMWDTHTLHLKKVSHLIFDNNFGKCGPIFKILLPTYL